MKYRIQLFILIYFILLGFACENPQETDKTPPNVTITYPTNNSEVHETVVIRFSVTDESNIVSSKILIDGINVGNVNKVDDIYEYYWETYSITNGTEHTIIAKATDEAGNTGQSQLLTVIVDNTGYDPQPVVLNDPTVNGSDVLLTWSTSNDIDFHHYELMRKDSITNTFTLVFTDSFSQSVVYTDSVIQNTSYEYFMKVIDNAGLFSESNHQKVNYTEFLPPAALDFTGLINGSFVELSWTPINIPDFGNYSLIRESTNLSITDTIKILDMSQSIYTDSVSQFNEYNYSLLAFDDFGNYASSDLISFVSSDFQPQAPLLSQPQVQGSNVLLNWSLNTDTDFQSYDIYRSANGLPMELIHQIDIQIDTTFVDSVVQGNSYLYLLSVQDQAGLYSNSNTVSIPAQTFNPTPVQLSSINLNGDEVSLTWTENFDIDFLSYRIEQSMDGGNYTNLLEILNQATTTISFNVIQYHDYTYRIVTVDSANLQSQSNTLNLLKEAFLPSPINLTSINLSGDTISLNWNYNTDIDFQYFEVLRNDVSISSIYDSTIHSYSDVVTQGFDYTYKIIVYDIASLSSTSNERTIYANEFNPPIVEIDSILFNGSGISIEWTPPNIPDFYQLDIIRSTDSLFSNQTVVYSVMDTNQSEYIDYTGQYANCRYFYKLKLIDNAGLFSISDWKYITFYHDIAFLGHYDYYSGRDLVLVESDGYNHRVLWSEDGVSALNIAISPDGKFCFLHTNQGFYILDLNNASVDFVKPLDDNSCCYKMYWSIDNNNVYFYEESDILYKYDKQSNSVSIIESEVQNFDYSPLSNTLVYSKEVDRGGIIDWDIFLHDGINIQNITNLSGENEYSPKINYSGNRVYYNKHPQQLLMGIDLSDTSQYQFLSLYDWNLNTMTFFNNDNIFMIGNSPTITQGLYEILDPSGTYNLVYPNPPAGYNWGQIDWSPDYNYFCFDKGNSIIIIDSNNYSNISEIDETNSLNPPNLFFPKWVKNKWIN